MPPLETVEVGPSGDASAAVIWLHGLGADGHDFEPVVGQLGLPPTVRFVFPHAPTRPVTINGGHVMRAWYDIVDASPDSEDEAGMRASDRLIRALIRRENERGVAHGRMVLAGFSQGGAMTLFTGLRYPQRLAGLMVLSAYLPVAEKTRTERSAENHQTPIFMAHGTYDPMLPAAFGRASKDALIEWGGKVDWREYPIAHSVSPDELGDIASWLSATIG